LILALFDRPLDILLVFDCQRVCHNTQPLGVLSHA